LCLAALYTISPLTIIVVIAGAIVLPPFTRSLRPAERRWFAAIVLAAALARLLAVGGLFVRNLPFHDDQFVGAMSGDEAYVMSRALRTRDIVRGSPTTKYDFFVAFDEYGRNGYVRAVTVAQSILGPTPYSLRLLNALLFTVAVLLLFRLCHGAFGALPAFGGLVVALFWPTLFAWSISLLKEPLYLLAGVVLLTAAIGIVRAPRWSSRAGYVVAAAAAAASVRDLRPGALLLAAAGLAVGFAMTIVTASKRRLIAGTVIVAIAATIAVAQPAIRRRAIAGLEAAARTQTGHVFTVGHAYKLLDAGFYVNPQTPAASTLTLTPEEAARFVLRAIGSFIIVPVPWQLQSARELVYLPEQVAWYAVALLLPIGIVAGCRRDRLVTCMLVGYAVPTAMALALTTGNVGTLLRLRGLVMPYIVWVSVLGFCATLGTLGRKEIMPFIDDKGRLFGRVNLFDAALAAFVVILVPIAYGTFLLFRTPAPRIASVSRVPITAEERRVAGGSRLSAKLKVRGSGLRPMLRASVGETPTLGFVFENPNSADVLVGDVHAGTHDLILYDGVQEVARLEKSVTIAAEPPQRVLGLGTLIQLDKAAADALAPGASLTAATPRDSIVALGPVRPELDRMGHGRTQAAVSGSRWERQAEILLQCDPDPSALGCQVGGVPLSSTTPPVVQVIGPSGTVLLFAVNEILPATSPSIVTARVRFAAAPEVLSLVHAGDRDECLDDRAATVLAAGTRRPGAGGGELDVTFRLGLDESAHGWRYRGRVFKAGVTFPFTTDRYMLEGTVLSVDRSSDGGTR
jgi:hypothetical protein